MILTYKNNFQVFFLSIIISIFINTRKIIFQIKYLYELNTRFFIFVIEIYIFYFLWYLVNSKFTCDLSIK